MKSRENAFYDAFVNSLRGFTGITNTEHPNVMTFHYNHPFRYNQHLVVCNDDMFDEFERFIDQNIEMIDEIFPKKFKYFKLDETTIGKLLSLAVNCGNNYEISCATRFLFIEDRLYVVKMLVCNKPEGIGFAMMKYDLIENDETVGSLMYVNQDTNLILNKVGGVCGGNNNDVLKAKATGKAGPIAFSIDLSGMLDPIASYAYLKNMPGISDDNLYVEEGSYKLPNFNTIDSVRAWMENEEFCGKFPFIGIASIRLKSNHLKLRKLLCKLFKPHVSLHYNFIKKQNTVKHRF